MTRSDLDRLRDARDYAGAALEIGRDVSMAALATDRARLHALLFRIVIIGEALGCVPNAITMLEPSIPWRDIVSTPHRIIHSYGQTDLSIVVGIVERQLVSLVAANDRLIATLERDEP